MAIPLGHGYLHGAGCLGGHPHGDDIAVACIGPAGENRVRWAIIQSRSENAAGQVVSAQSGGTRS